MLKSIACIITSNKINKLISLIISLPILKVKNGLSSLTISISLKSGIRYLISSESKLLTSDTVIFISYSYLLSFFIKILSILFFSDTIHSRFFILYFNFNSKIVRYHKLKDFFSLSWCFFKNSWFTNSFMVTLSAGFFCKHLSKKSLASPDTYTYDGIFISSLTIFMSSYSFVILNGFSPTTISYIMIPKDQISIF